MAKLTFVDVPVVARAAWGRCVFWRGAIVMLDSDHGAVMLVDPATGETKQVTPPLVRAGRAVLLLLGGGGVGGATASRASTLAVCAGVATMTSSSLAWEG